MKTFRACLLALAAALSLAFSGCSNSVKLGGITEVLAAIQATDTSLSEGRATLTVRYANGNISALGFSGATHKLSLNGTFVGKAVSTTPFGIPPLTAIDQDVTVQLENVALVRQLLTAGTATYQLESVLTQTIYEDNYTYKVNAGGSVSLQPTAPAAK